MTATVLPGNEEGKGRGSWGRRKEEEEKKKMMNKKIFVCLFCWLLDVSVTGLCLSGTDLLMQLYVLPH